MSKEAAMHDQTTQISRRRLLEIGAAGTAAGAAALALPGLAIADVSHGSEQIGEIYELQAAFHRAKTTQNLDLMMSLWADEATFTNHTSTGTMIFNGAMEIRGFWQNSGSFKNHRFSLVPSFKTTIQVHGNQAFLYFECHDIGNFASGSFNDPSQKMIINDTYLAGTLRKIGSNWVFWDMTAGSSSPLSYDTYYFPIP
jgi:hypothetical protein